MTAGQTLHRDTAKGGRGGTAPEMPVRRGGSVPSILFAIASVSALALFWRWYQQAYAFKNGLNSHDPGFAKYWLGMAAANMILLPIAAGVWYVWLWASAQKLPKDVSRKEESRRLWNLWLLVAAFTTSVYWGGSYFAEEDASWHQIVIRDTAFTPSHSVLFYGVFPLMIYMAGGLYLYGRTRLPHIYGGKRFPVSFALMISGTVLLFFQVTMNEFGHSFFQPEELFAAPLHWPFVLFGYLLAGTFAIWFETLPRIMQLARQEKELSQAAGAPVATAVAAAQSGDTAAASTR
ncbi:ammonia monooxygenase [Mycobacterium sp. SM1]|nr:ammonia monooxygenase [Mycobacterium sp. SM1]